MGPKESGTAQAAVYIDGQPVQYAGEITLPEITEDPEQAEHAEAPPAMTCGGSMTITLERASEAMKSLAGAWDAICTTLAAASRAVSKMWAAYLAAEEFRKALRWAEAANRPLAARYHRTKKKRIRKKYAKRILTWYWEEIL